MPNTSLFQEVKRFINMHSVGSTYQSGTLCNFTSCIEEVTAWKRRNNNLSYRTRTYQTYLKRLGFIKPVKRGEWQVIAHIPEWLDSGVVNCALGYGGRWSHGSYITGEYKGLERATWESKIKAYLSHVTSVSVTYNEPEKTEPKEGVQPGESIATFNTVDALTSLIELRRIGVLAVPVSQYCIEVHIINKDSAEKFAEWMIENNFELNDHPSLENLLRAYWPTIEPIQPVEKKNLVTLTVLDYSQGKVDVIQNIPADDVEEYISDNYYPNEHYYMTTPTLKLEIREASEY